MPRVSQAEFAYSFHKFAPVCITGAADDEVIGYCKKVKLANRNLQLQNMFPIDPVSILARKLVHQSWVGIKNLQYICKDLHYLESYELYHFYSGQVADAASYYNIPFICEVWTSFLHPAYFLPPYSLTVKKVVKRADLFVARSNRAKEALVRFGIPEKKITVIYHGIDTSIFKPKMKQKKGNVVLFVGQLEPYKGVEMLLNIWLDVHKACPGSTLVLVGDGSLKDRAKVTPGVKVQGYVTRDNLPGFYREADIFVSPSQDRYIGPFLWWEEFFSYTLMEAQASGLPIIATKSGGVPEETGENNWLIPQKNEYALREALIEALSNKKKREEIGAENRTRAEKFYNLEKQTAILEKEIEKL